MLLEDIDLPSCLSAVPRAAAMGRALRDPPRAQRPGQLTQELQEEMDEHRELMREHSHTPGCWQQARKSWRLGKPSISFAVCTEMSFPNLHSQLCWKFSLRTKQSLVLTMVLAVAKEWGKWGFPGKFLAARASPNRFAFFLF